MAKAGEELEKYNWHWRNTMRTIRFFGFDARAAVPWCVLLVYARLPSLLIAVMVTMIFWFLERAGLTLPAALRSFRSWVNGPDRPAIIHRKHRRFRDFG